jgi:non-ribosomal peptide synthetase-like protein
LTNKNHNTACGHEPSPELLQPGLLHELFEQKADAHPGNVALICAGGRMTYAELERRANQLARHLRSRGVKRGDCVAMLLPRSLEVCVALLGILKSGAAYVPLDPGIPADRVGFVLADCQARALVTTKLFAAKAANFHGEIVALDERQPEIASQPAARLNQTETGATPEDLCYIIYTSGSTGQPKGVQIEQRSACHLVRCEGQIFQVRPGDRVYQGFSIAFDASVEEVWLAFFAGATLVVGNDEMVHAGAGLSRMLADAGVTVLSCVPTLLSMMDEDVPSVRLLILGGEQCPPDLVKRWWRPGRRVVNTYGPTEATVIATWADCHPNKPVTIGRPLPNYFAAILDEQLLPVAQGQSGELCLGGIGLARGYVGQPDLTREKFVENSAANNGHSPSRLYRTGDLARFSPGGEIEFLGRLDSQVKIRGFRVELSEIESVLLECPGVQAAAVALREDTPGAPQLVAYLIPRTDAPPDEPAIRTRLRARLPVYMMPALFETIQELPMLSSGKADRLKLPPPRQRAAQSRPEAVAPRTKLEQHIAAVWTKLFVPVPVSVRDDFFLDLGGHSLLAARMVSELRKEPPFQSLSMLDVYQHPSIERLAAQFEKDFQTEVPPVSAKTNSIPWSRHFLCGCAQFIAIGPILGFFALQWLAPFLTYTWMIEADYDYHDAIFGALAIFVVLYPLMLLTAIVVKWLVIGRYRPGAYPLWGVYFLRWWFVTAIQSAVPIAYLTGTPLLNIYFRLMGAKIGRNVYLGTEDFAIYDLLTIGDDTSIGSDSGALGCTVEDGMLLIGTVTIGKRCFVGTRSILRENTVMEDDAALEDLSLLPRGGKIPHGETWLGSPARPSGRAKETSPAQPLAKWRHFAVGMLHAAGLLIFPLLVVSAILPGIIAMNELNYADDYYWYLFLSPFVGLSFVILLALEIVVVKWLLLGRVKPGRHPLHSFFYFRKWFADQTFRLSLDVLGPLYASVYLPPWYRMLGAKLGKGVEVSTASFISPDLLSIAEEGFVADAVSLGATRVRNGFVTVAGNHIGKRSFIGNSAVLPPGTVIGESCLIGCLSIPPADAADAMRADTSWLGSPAIFLPQRQPSAAFGEEQTYKPPRRLRVLRALIELVRVILPSSCFVALTSLLFSVMVLIEDDITLWQMLCLLPALYAACGITAVLFTALVKWILVGRYHAGEKPLWCSFVWRNELINALHEHLADAWLLGMLTRTPFVCWYFRLLGAKIGRRVYMDTTDFSEFDLATIGDEAMLNADCTIQTHLFEDRVMKMGTIEIAPRCKVGSGTLVLYDTKMEAGATLGELSLLMKGETLPANTRWTGIPARRHDTNHA